MPWQWPSMDSRIMVQRLRLGDVLVVGIALRVALVYWWDPSGVLSRRPELTTALTSLDSRAFAPRVRAHLLVRVLRMPWRPPSDPHSPPSPTLRRAPHSA